MVARDQGETEADPKAGIMREWYYVFEGEDGLVSGTVKAATLKSARAQLAKRYPKDIGADGEIEDPGTGTVHFAWSSS